MPSPYSYDLRIRALKMIDEGALRHMKCNTTLH
ncbi:hypothetical protein PsalBI1_04662 (plasmid) [Piscirickettsia salmonis]|nr:hypothetical protein PsalBI1_04662 [Piscirickettsia salmonis]